MVERTEAQAGLGRWHERLVCDPSEILGGAASDGDLPAAERARRERLREQADGITSFDTDHNVTNVVFTLGGSSLPQAPLQGGSWMVSSVGSAVKAVCEKSGSNCS